MNRVFHFKFALRGWQTFQIEIGEKRKSASKQGALFL
jgi:hypothetical protein